MLDLPQLQGETMPEIAFTPVDLLVSSVALKVRSLGILSKHLATICSLGRGANPFAQACLIAVEMRKGVSAKCLHF